MREDGHARHAAQGWNDQAVSRTMVPTVTAIATAAEATMDRLIDLLIAQDLLRPGRERGNQFRLPSRVPGRPRAYKIRRPEILRFAAAEHGDAGDSGDRRPLTGARIETPSKAPVYDVPRSPPHGGAD